VDLHDLSALECAAAIRDGSATSMTLVEACLERIASHNDAVGGFVAVLADAARADATRCDAAVSAARRAGELAELPPLVGVPIAVKELTAVAGAPMTGGSAAVEPRPSESDDNVVSAMRTAGMVVLGTTAASEFGLSAYTDPDGRPPARTPWDRTRSAGGSSGGSGAAVAMGLVPWAHGTDGGGSVRTPASVCGLIGLKPTRGRVSNGPRHGEGAGLAVHGVLTRTVADAGAWLDAVAVPAPDDSTWLPPPLQRFADAATAPIRGRLRLGRCAVPLLADVSLHPDVEAAYDETCQLLAEMGHDLVEVAPPFTRDAAADFETVWAAGAAAIPIPADREDRLRPLARWLRTRGRRLSAVDYVEALGRLQSAARAALAASNPCDATVVPTLASPPVGIDELRNDADPAADFAAQERFNPFSAAYNLTGQPAITVPVAWTPAGLPIGVQIVGRPGEETTLLGLAAALEEARPWTTRRPPTW
jgi:amidase